MNTNSDRKFEPGKYYPRKGLFIKCPNCEREFHGRRNQKYCDVTCRNEYHNGKRSEKSSHIELKKLKETDRALELLYEKFREKAIPELVLDVFGLCDECIHRNIEDDEYEISCYLNYALLYNKEEGSFRVITIEEAGVLEKESMDRLLELIEKDPSVLKGIEMD